MAPCLSYDFLWNLLGKLFVIWEIQKQPRCGNSSCSKMAPWSKAWPLTITCPVCILTLSLLSPAFLGQFAKPLSSVQFSGSVMSDSFADPDSLQHSRLPCPSPTPGAYSNSCALSWWCHPTFLSSVVPFSSHLQSFPASGSFQMSQFFTSGDQSIGVSASASVLPMNTQDWSPLRWTSWISLRSKGFSRVFSNTTVQKHQFFSLQLSL